MIPYAVLRQPRNTDLLSMFAGLPADVQFFIRTGQTDLRRSIDGLSSIVEYEYGLNPFSKSMYLFCGSSSKTTLRALYFDGFGFVLMVVRTEGERYKWPLEKPAEMWKISHSTFLQLLRGERVTKEDALRVFEQLKQE